MIYWVRFEDVSAHLEELGFTLVGTTEESRTFVRSDRRISVRAPNVDGDLPEIFVNDAFDAAGLDPPCWNVFWCD